MSSSVGSELLLYSALTSMTLAGILSSLKANFYGLTIVHPLRSTYLDGDGESPRIESISFSTLSCFKAKLALIAESF